MSSTDSDWRQVATIDEFQSVGRVKCTIDHTDVLIFRLDDAYYAVQNKCTHLGQPLEKGRLMSGQLACPFHGACFDIRTGKALSGPAVSPLVRYPVKVDGDDIYIGMARGT